MIVFVFALGLGLGFESVSKDIFTERVCAKEGDLDITFDTVDQMVGMYGGGPQPAVLIWEGDLHVVDSPVDIVLIFKLVKRQLAPLEQERVEATFAALCQERHFYLISIKNCNSMAKT